MARPPAPETFARPADTGVAAAAGAPPSVPPSVPPSAGERTTTDKIVASVTAAIVERRLMPGTKLVEQQIAGIFKVSRTVVRQALNQLSRDKLVTLEPARGAFVREPSVVEARQVYEVRTMLEGAMLRELAARISDVQVARLRQHLADEAAAIVRTDVPGRTRLLADFHSLLASMLGNAVLAEMLSDLLSRCSLISLMYQNALSAQESSGEHAAIVEALARRDGAAAVTLLEDHLGNVERNLRLNPRVADLATALQPDMP